MQVGAPAPFKAFNQPDFPQGLFAVKVFGVKVGGNFTQACAVARTGESDMLDMVVEAEIFVFYPVGPVQACSMLTM